MTTRYTSLLHRPVAPYCVAAVLLTVGIPRSCMRRPIGIFIKTYFETEQRPLLNRLPSAPVGHQDHFGTRKKSSA